MIRFSKTAGLFAMAVATVMTASLAVNDAALAAGGVATPDVVVPSQPAPVPVPVPTYGPDGCYRVNQPLYGPYYMSFCIQGRNGSYQVTGGGIDCRGSLRVTNTGPREARIRLRTSHCGRGVDWSADSLYCQFGGVAGFIERPQGGAGGLSGPNVVVPSQPAPAPVPVPGYITQLRCNYQPSVAGYPAVSISADRYR
jgi:hypothetical protein